MLIMVSLENFLKILVLPIFTEAMLETDVDVNEVFWVLIFSD
jgi:hypothetical protein